MNKKIKYLICLIVLVSLVFGAYFCCKNQKNTDKIKIQFSSWGSESEVKILKPILADFEKENPNIKVEFLHIPQNYFQKIHLLFASNTSVDVLFINNQYLPTYANAGVLEDLSSLSEYFEFDKFYGKSLDAMKWKGKIYAIPRDVSNMVIFYNKDLFKKNNLNYLSDKTTPEDLVKIAKKITNRPNIFGISFDEEPIYYLPYITAFGEKGIPDISKKSTLKGVNFYSDLRKKYYVAPKKEDVASATMAQMFLQGRLGMLVSGRWLVPKFREEVKFDWDVSNFPTTDEGYNPLDASGWAVSKSSKHKNEALKLVKYLSSKESSEKFVQSGLIVPARIDCANSKYFLDGKKPQNAKVFLSVIEKSQPTPVNIDYREVLDNLKSQTEHKFN
jgi:multiple sugar transport system substrate-binding protein